MNELLQRLASVCAGVTLVAGLSPNVLGQVNPPAIEWEKTFGGVRSDEAHSVQQTADGGYIVGGSTSSFGAGSDDVYLIKLDPEGELDPRWPENPRTFGGRERDVAHSVEQTADGGYVIVICAGG